jgi:hypothetical protein
MTARQWEGTAGLRVFSIQTKGDQDEQERIAGAYI